MLFRDEVQRMTHSSRTRTRFLIPLNYDDYVDGTVRLLKFSHKLPNAIVFVNTPLTRVILLEDGATSRRFGEIENRISMFRVLRASRCSRRNSRGEFRSRAFRTRSSRVDETDIFRDQLFGRPQLDCESRGGCVHRPIRAATFPPPSMLLLDKQGTLLYVWRPR